jgi:hypothetical protein
MITGTQSAVLADAFTLVTLPVTPGKPVLRKSLPVMPVEAIATARHFQSVQTKPITP